MRKREMNASDAPSPAGGYSQAVEAEGVSRIVHVSGQIPVDVHGRVPASFEEQARLVWKHIERQLAAADMGLENIVKHTTFLASRQYREANRTIRQEVLGDLSPALTVVIADIFDEAWLLEIEAVAMAWARISRQPQSQRSCCVRCRRARNVLLRTTHPAEENQLSP